MFNKVPNNGSNGVNSNNFSGILGSTLNNISVHPSSTTSAMGLIHNIYAKNASLSP
jgi:hypothetical protein